MSSIGPLVRLSFLSLEGNSNLLFDAYSIGFMREGKGGASGGLARWLRKHLCEGKTSSVNEQFFFKPEMAEEQAIHRAPQNARTFQGSPVVAYRALFRPLTT